MDYYHTKFGLIWIKESNVMDEEGRICPPPPPPVENVLNRSGEIGLNQLHLSSRLNKSRQSSCRSLYAKYSACFSSYICNSQLLRSEAVIKYNDFMINFDDFFQLIYRSCAHLEQYITNESY